MSTLRTWCCNTPIHKPHEKSCNFMPKPDDEVYGPAFVRWDESDLDRCEHGRHSIDSCIDCPNEQSSGNLFLLGLSLGKMTTRIESGTVRIGTAINGEGIWVSPVRKGRQ